MKREWFWGLALFLTVVLVYAPVWRAGFIWDDVSMIVANPVIVGPLGLKEIWTTRAADICPLTLTAFWLEHALWELQPLAYHLVNLALHGANAILLWRVLRNLRIPGAWLGAALWALHPVEVESVAWIAETKNTLSGLFYLGAIFFFIKFLRSEDDKSRWYYAWTLLASALAIAAKSSTVILPLVLCLCAWWVEGRWHWRNLLRVAPLFVLSLVAGIVSVLDQRSQEFNDGPGLPSLPQRLAAGGDAVWFYLGKLLWPHPLVPVYPRWDIDAGTWLAYLPLLAVIVVLAIFWLKRESWSRIPFFTYAYFLATLLPVLGLENMYYYRYSFVADHLQYLAGIGPLALIGAGLAWFSNAIISGNAWLKASLSAGLLLVLGALTWQQVSIYENDITLWSYTVTRNPSCWLGYVDLGFAYASQRDFDAAIEQYDQALALHPRYAKGRYDLGNSLIGEGRLDEAIEQYKKALQINPSFAEVYNNLGAALSQKGQLDEALAAVKEALRLKPDYADAQNNLARMEAFIAQHSARK